MRNVARCLCSNRLRRPTNPLYVHGPSGTGKTHMVSTLIDEVTRQASGLVVTLLQAGDFDLLLARSPDGIADDNTLQAARDSDLLVVEDMQYLAARSSQPSRAGAAVEAFVQLFDHLYARQRQMVFTADMGPGQLAHLSARLRSRLACGLVVGLEPLQAASRLRFLEDRSQRRQLAIGREVLNWLAERLTGGGRQLEGVVAQLETLVRSNRRPLDLEATAAYFRGQLQVIRPTVERIAHRVSNYFRVAPTHLQSRRRYQSALLPRQVSMYLARQLTDLSLQEIGRYFGGRDHSTVLHACRKIEQGLRSDAALAGTVRQLKTDLR